MMSANERDVTMPSAVRSRLRAVRRKQIMMRAAETVPAALAVLLVATLLAMGIDYAVVLFSPAARAAVTLLALMAASAAAVVGLVRLVLAWRRLPAVALDVEQHVPALQERWSTVVELAEGHDAPPVRGSEVLIGQVAREAETLVPAVARERLVSGRALRWCVAAAAAATVLFALVLTMGGATGRVLLERFLRPMDDITLTQVASLTGDCAVPRGEPLEIQAGQSGRRCASATLAIRNGDDLPHEVSLTAGEGEGPSFRYPIRAVNESFAYRIRCGDGQTPWHEVTAVDRPEIAQVKFRIVPPEYARREPVSADALPRQCRALEGSRLSVSLLPSKAVEEMSLHVEKGDAVKLARGDGQWYVFDVLLDKTLAFRVHARDSYGLTNAKPPSCRIVVYPDQPPSIEIVSPEEEISVRPDEVVPVDVRISDDIGIESAELVVSRNIDGEEKVVKVVPIDVARDRDGQPPKGVRARAEIDLKEFELKQNDELTYAVQASDTRQAVAQASGTMGQGRANPGASRSQGQTAQGQQGRKDEREAREDGARREDGREPREGEQGAGDPKEARASESPRDSQGGQCEGSSSSTASQQPSHAGDRRDGEEPLESAAKPPNDMEKRQLPGSPKACSSRNRIQIDQWAGAYEGQRRQKLQLDIERYLADLDGALAAAQPPVQGLIEHVRGRSAWGAEQAGQLGIASGHLVRGDEVVKDLLRVSHGTPYAFMGFQLQDINVSHMAPAWGLLADAARTADRAEEQYKQLEQAGYHIARARARLADLTKQYEAVKREKDLEEAIAHVKKMHQMFLEDLHAMLGACEPKLNPRPGQMVELPDEEMAKLQALIQARHEELKKLMAALAEVMEKDPELLRRFMAAMRMSGRTVRDQLTLLTMRQQGLHTDVTDWTGGNRRRESARLRLSKCLVAEQAAMAEAAAALHDNMTTWLPRDVDSANEAARSSRSEAGRIAQSARELSLRTASGGVAESSIVGATELATALMDFDAALSRLAAAGPGNDRLAQFVVKRKAEARELATQEAGWAVKAAALGKDQYGRLAGVDQAALLVDTMSFGEKLERYEAMLGRMTPEIGSKARQLRALVGETSVGHQTMAQGALSREALTEARTSEGEALKAMKEAETVFDEMLTLIEKNAMDRAKPVAPEALCKLPSLEELLAMLENEGEACEKLGAAAMMVNLMIQGDWQLPGSAQADGQGSGPGSGQGAMGQAQMARAALQRAIEQMEKMRQQARQEGQRVARRSQEAPGPLDPAGPRVPGDEKQWNTLVSKLEKELRQARDHVPPEQYRQFIEDYFRTVAERLEESKSQE